MRWSRTSRCPSAYAHRKKRDKYVRMWLAMEGQEPKLLAARPSVGIELQEPFYVGIGVCSHNKDVTEKRNLRQRRTEHRLASGDGAADALQHAGDADDYVDRSPRHDGHQHAELKALPELAEGW